MNFKFVCPDCDKDINFRESFNEKRLPDNDTDQISIICPNCESEQISYYTNTRIRNNIKRLRNIRDATDDPKRLQKYTDLKRKHQKYFDKFNTKMKSGGLNG